MIMFTVKLFRGIFCLCFKCQSVAKEAAEIKKNINCWPSRGTCRERGSRIFFNII